MRSIRRLQGGTWDVGLSLNKLKITYLQIHTWASQVVLVVENLSSSAEVIRYVDSIPGLGRSPGRGHGNALQYSCLENPMDRGTWKALDHGDAKTQT